MVKKVVIIEGKERGLDEVTGQVEKLNTSIEKVEGSSKETDGALKKVADNGGAISTLDAFTGGLATRIRDAAEATKVFNFNLKGTKTALIATGIGAFVVAVGLVVAYWDDIVDLITGANSRLEDQIKLLERKSKILESEVTLLDKQLELNKLQGLETEELRKKKIELLRAQIAINGAELASLQAARERNIERAKEITFLERVKGVLNPFGSGRLGALDAVSDEEADEIAEQTSRINELQASILDTQIALEQLLNPSSGDSGSRAKTDGVDIAQDEAFIQAENRLKAFKKVEEERFDITKQLQNSALEATQEFLDSDLALRAQADQKRTASEEAMAKIRKQIAMEEAQAKIQSYNIAANGFAAASQLIGQETAAGKAFAIASTLVSTYLSAQQAYQSQLTIPTPDAPARAAAAAAVAVAAGLANVKQILSIPIPGQGNSSATTAPSQRPTFNVVGASAENQINQSLLENNNEPVQAFVVDKEVTSSQELRRNKRTASSF